MDDETAVLRSTTGESLALLGVAAKGTVNGLFFDLAVEQRYRNPAATNIEAVYTFPLPTGAVLLDFQVTIGGKLLTGIVVEKKAAEAQYEEAIEKGDTAIMLERAGSGLCTVNLGNLMAGEEATIRYRYAQLLRFEHGSVRLAVPTVIAPRYGDPAQGGLQPHQVPETDLAVEYPFTLALSLRGEIAGGTIASPSHPLALVRTADGVDVTLARSAALDRDFVLTIAGLATPSLAAVAADGEGFVALASFWADVPRSAPQLPLRLKLVLDCSGLMAGDSIDAAKRALRLIFADLSPADRFSFTRFGSHVVHEIDSLVAASPAMIRKAAARAAKSSADLGGTEMEGALSSVFALGGTEGGADLLVITDGEIWGVDSLIAEARSANQRVFVVGIGSAPAEGVLRGLAEATGGACEFVAPNEDAEAAILRMFARLRAPRVEHAEIDWPQKPKWVTPLPRGLFGGETIHVWAGFDAPPIGDVALRLMSATGETPLVARTALPSCDAQDTAFARMAAASRIPSASEDAQLALALHYGLLTDRTNLIVVHARAEGEKAQALPQLHRVAQMHAAGWGGVGSVMPSMAYVACHSVSEFDFAASEMPMRRSRRASTGSVDHAVPPVPSTGSAATDESVDARDGYRFVIVLLDHHLSGSRRTALARTLAELTRFGVAGEISAALAALVAQGHAESDVLRAFFEALVPWAIAMGASRQLLRALRNQFKAPERCADLRSAVAAIVGVPGLVAVD